MLLKEAIICKWDLRCQFTAVYFEFYFPGVYSRRESSASSGRFERLAREVRKISGRGIVGRKGHFCLSFIAIHIIYRLHVILTLISTFIDRRERRENTKFTKRDSGREGTTRSTSTAGENSLIVLQLFSHFIHFRPPTRKSKSFRKCRDCDHTFNLEDAKKHFPLWLLYSVSGIIQLRWELPF